MHTNALELLNTKSVTLRILYTESFNTQTRLHTDFFAQRSLYAESFYTRKLLHTDIFLHRRTFTQRSFHTQKEAFTKEVFTQRKLLHTKYTEKSLHRGAFTRSNKLKLAATADNLSFKVCSLAMRSFLEPNM